MRNTVTVCESWLPASRNCPVGSMPKPRGVLPWVDLFSTKRERAVAASTANTVMLSCPRFEPYTNLPEGCTCTSAVLYSGLA